MIRHHSLVCRCGIADFIVFILRKPCAIDWEGVNVHLVALDEILHSQIPRARGMKYPP